MVGQREPAQTEFERTLQALERADAIASATALDELLDQMLALLIDIAGAVGGTLYLLEGAHVALAVIRGDEASERLRGATLPAEAGVLGRTLAERRVIVVEDVRTDAHWDHQLGELAGLAPKAVISLPLLLNEQPLGAIQLFDPQQRETRLLQLLAKRMASEIEKARLLKRAKARETRLSALIEIIGHIGSTLDRRQLLDMIMEYARRLLAAEASSLFLIDEASGDLVLHVSTGPSQDKMQAVRVPKGKGIAGYVAATGETVLVGDVSADTRHYASVDAQSGFATRSILAVPLVARTITLGGEREDSHEHIIGCIEALNKRHGTFDEDDVLLLQTLARQAATVLEIAKLYADVNELFLDVIQSLTAAIDAKDPYTEGHSQRVAEFAVAIAQVLECPADFVHHLRIGAILHDVGKIGVSDSVLKKPGKLTDEEFGEMRAHPTIGERILGHIRLLRSEMPVILEHHERLDGSGYPQGMRGDVISLGGRIAAVADAFDAMTSNRPYRAGLPVEEAFRRLRAGVGTEFDAHCVEALWQAYERGLIHTQRERSVSPSEAA